MFLPYVSGTIVTAFLPKRFVKSLRYISILCSFVFHCFFLNKKGIDPRNLFNKKSKYCRKHVKTCTNFFVWVIDAACLSAILLAILAQQKSE